MTKIAVTTQKAPRALGPYSQAIVHGSMVFISGQIPLDPDTDAIVSGNTEAQIIQVFSNLATVAEAAGCNLDDCLKLSVYLIDLTIFDTVNEIMTGIFSEPYPTRSVVEVSSLPKNAILEIDATLARLTR